MLLRVVEVEDHDNEDDDVGNDDVVHFVELIRDNGGWLIQLVSKPMQVKDKRFFIPTAPKSIHALPSSDESRD